MTPQEDTEIPPVCINGNDLETSVDRLCYISGDKMIDKLDAFYINTLLPVIEIGLGGVTGLSLSNGKPIAASICVIGIFCLGYAQREMQNDAVKDIAKYESERRKR